MHLSGASKTKYWLNCSSFVSSVLVDAGIPKVVRSYTTENLRNTDSPNCGFIAINHEDVKPETYS